MAGLSRLCHAAIVVAVSTCIGLGVEAQPAGTPTGAPTASWIPHNVEAPSTHTPVSGAAFPMPSYLTSTLADNPAVQWNLAIQWVISSSNATNLAPRAFAFTHLAMWQALRANNASETPANPNAVASFAAMLTLKDLLPLYFDRYNALFAQQTARISASDLDAAHEVAGPVVSQLLSTRLDDGFQLPTSAAPSAGPAGEFLDTGVAKNQPVQQYAFTEPLLLPSNLSSLDFVADCDPPPDVPSPAYNIQYTSAQLYGSANSDVRSYDQTNAAIFWADGGAGTSSILGQWNRVVLNTLPASLSLLRTAELLAKFNVAMYDSTVAIFNLKYKFDFWRPITAIRNGDPSHVPQPLWTPLLSNPNNPTYPSIGAAYAGVAEKTLNSFYGRDTLTFSVSTENRGINGLLLPNRVYQSFTQVASEVVQSRYFGGMEFPIDSIQGRVTGGEVGQYVLDHFEELDYS